jgi:hypothetical protein
MDASLEKLLERFQLDGNHATDLLEVTCTIKGYPYTSCGSGQLRLPRSPFTTQHRFCIREFGGLALGATRERI